MAEQDPNRTVAVAGDKGLPPWAKGTGSAPEGFQPFDPAEVEGTLHGRILRQAANHAGSAAIQGATHTYSYAQLDQFSARVATDLVARLGTGSEPVALLFAHDAPLVVTLLGVLRAGKIVLVLDPLAPEDVQRLILADSGARLILADGASVQVARKAARETPAEVVAQAPFLAAPPAEPDPADAVADEAADPEAPGEVDQADPAGQVEMPAEPEPETEPEPESEPEPDVPFVELEVDPGAGAMLAYTSGTTGTPKAALLSHRALLHLMRGATDALAVAPDDVIPMLFPVALAVAAYPMFLPLVNGATLATYDMRSEGLAPFGEFLNDRKVTLAYMSPTVARFLGGAMAGRTFPDLRLIVLGGERVDASAVAIVREVFGGHVVVGNGYGTTETGVLTFYFPDADETFGIAGVPVGRPIPGMDLLLYDAEGELVAPGEAGELLVRSRYLFSGYWNRPDLDELVIVPDNDPAVITYRTGDVGRIDPDGNLELLGRSDLEVKIRGHRVVPGEVEAALLSLDEVADAVVLPQLGRNGDTMLVGYVVTAGPGIDATRIRERLGEVVKAHLVPAHLLLLSQLPQLPNGKLDRQSLPIPGRERTLRHIPLVKPRDELERTLAAVWETVLHVDEVGITDPFDELGGQSLDAAWMLVVLEEQHGIRLPMGELIGVRTVEQLADRVRSWQAASSTRQTTVVPVQAGKKSRPRLFFTHDLHGSAFSLRYLAPLLGTDQPVVGFDSPLLRGPESPFSRLETLALRYITDLRRLQPEGPYYLAGYSFGGVLAFEMARQLRNDGEEVPFLGVLDVGPGYRGRHYDPHKMLDKPWMRAAAPPDPELSLVEQVRYYADLGRRSPEGLAEHLALRTGLDRYTDKLLFRRDLHKYGEIHPGHRVWYAWRKHWELASSYNWEGRSYDGPLTLLWADETGATDGTMGWRDVVTGPIDIVHVNVLHEQFLQQEGAAVIAPLLRDALNQAVSGRARQARNAGQ